jgi:sarcosine/dimethylglycine N-methyltransferase
MQMTASEGSQIEADRDVYRKFYDTNLSALLSAIWGGNLHMGWFTNLDESLEQAQKRTKERIALSAGLRGGQQVIEAACGVGTTALYLAQRLGVRVHATNIAEAQLAEAASRAEAAGLSKLVNFAFADYHDLGGPSAAYDCWLCQEALLYATDKHRVFSEARRVVKPGGRIVFTDLTLSAALPEKERQKFMSDIRAPHLWAIGEYDQLITDMNFNLIERQEWNHHAAGTFAAVARNLTAVRADFASRIGEETVRSTERRIARQLDMARAGHLGWCCYALKV